MSDTLPRVGSALLVKDEANRILLGKRNKDPQKGSWVIPGGKIHAFESIAEAAAREVSEETGLQVEVKGQFGVYEVINAPDEHRLVIYSWGTVVGGELKASDDLSEVNFFSIDELGNVPTTPLVRKVLADAGLIAGAKKELAPQHIQLNLFMMFPLPLAGAHQEVEGRPRQRGRAQRHRRRVVANTPLLFDYKPVAGVKRAGGRRRRAGTL